MTNSRFAALAHVRLALVCCVLSMGLAACGSDEVASGSGTVAAVAPNVGHIDRGSPTGQTPPVPDTNTDGSNSGQGSQTPGGNPPTASAGGCATLDWTPPTENNDGSSLTNLAGYYVYYGTSPDDLSQSVKIANPGLSAFTVTNLTSGTWYFAVSSYSASGVESVRTGVVSTQI